EPRLRRERRVGRTVGQSRTNARTDLSGHCIKCLRKDLPGRFVLKHVGSGSKVDTTGQFAAETSNIPKFEDHLSGEGALNCEVDYMRATVCEVGIVLEAQDLAQRRRWDNRRLQCARYGWSGDGAVNTDAEDGASGRAIHVAVGAWGARCVADRRLHVNGLG